MANTPVPTISTAGWVSDPSGKLDHLLAYYFTSHRNQDALFPQSVSSISYTLAKNSYDPEQAASDIQETLRRYLGRYFQNVSVNVTTNADTTTQTGTIVYIIIDFVDDGYSSTGSYVYDAKTSVFSKVVDVINQ